MWRRRSLVLLSPCRHSHRIALIALRPNFQALRAQGSALHSRFPVLRLRAVYIQRTLAVTWTGTYCAAQGRRAVLLSQKTGRRAPVLRSAPRVEDSSCARTSGYSLVACRSVQPAVVPSTAALAATAAAATPLLPLTRTRCRCCCRQHDPKVCSMGRKGGGRSGFVKAARSKPFGEEDAPAEPAAPAAAAAAEPAAEPVNKAAAFLKVGLCQK